MTREEAIKTIQTATVWTDEEREALGVLIPELAESEDEKARKEAISIVQSYINICDEEGDPCLSGYKVLAYLEKLKVNTEGDFGRGYDCGYQAGYAVAMNEMKPKVATATLDSEKQKEQKPSSKFRPGDWVVYDGPLGHAILQVEDVVGGRYSFVDNVSTLLAEDSDEFLRPLTPEDVEKPAEKQDYSGLNNLERAIHRGFLSAGIENIPVTIIKETAKECLAQMEPAEWKPTEEQLKYLAKAIMTLGEEGDCKTAGVLREIRNGLKCSFPDWKVSQDYPKEGCNVSLNGEVKKIQEWSEEDEEKLKEIIDIISYSPISEELKNEYVSFLKSLHPQPKAELTLLDENIIKAAVAFVEQNDHFNCWGGIDKHTVIKALRSLKPHWKPSKEQMEALLNIEGDLRAFQYNDKAKIIAELYEQLKKL